MFVLTGERLRRLDDSWHVMFAGDLSVSAAQSPVCACVAAARHCGSHPLPHSLPAPGALHHLPLHQLTGSTTASLLLNACKVICEHENSRLEIDASHSETETAVHVSVACRLGQPAGRDDPVLLPNGPGLICMHLSCDLHLIMLMAITYVRDRNNS